MLRETSAIPVRKDFAGTAENLPISRAGYEMPRKQVPRLTRVPKLKSSIAEPYRQLQLVWSGGDASNIPSQLQHDCSREHLWGDVFGGSHYIVVTVDRANLLRYESRGGSFAADSVQS